MKKIVETKETHSFYPVNGKDKARLTELLMEVVLTLLSRSDGVAIEIERTNEFPPLVANMPKKHLITGVKINTWDIAA